MGVFFLGNSSVLLSLKHNVCVLIGWIFEVRTARLQMFLHSCGIDSEIFVFGTKIAVADSFFGFCRGRCLGESPPDCMISLIMCFDRRHV